MIYQGDRPVGLIWPVENVGVFQLQHTLAGAIAESTPPLVTLKQFREQLQTIAHMGICHDQ